MNDNWYYYIFNVCLQSPEQRALWKSWRVRAYGARSMWLVRKPKGHLVLLLQFNQTLMFKVHVSDCRSHELEIVLFIFLFDVWRRYTQVQCSTTNSQLQGFPSLRSLLVHLAPRSRLGSYAKYQIIAELFLKKKKSIVQHSAIRNG